VVDVRDNLLPGLDIDAVEREFAAGAGKELASKMRAPWSSSALAVNAFLPWREDPTGLTVAGCQGFSPGFKFEVACANGVSGFDSYLDLILRRGDEVVAIESKCTEFMQGSSHEAVATSYRRLRDRNDPRCASRWYAALDMSRTSSFAIRTNWSNTSSHCAGPSLKVR
jgi:hypothetical protein